jgi:predicted nucleic acid-binding protein
LIALVVVVDASLIVDALLADHPRLLQRLSAERDRAAPHIIDLEVLRGFRSAWHRRMATEERLAEAVADFRAFSIERYSHEMLVPRIWQLRANLSTYDAAYVALAEVLGIPLFTRDARLARTTAHTARIEYID